jgi:hypothetical protein
VGVTGSINLAIGPYVLRVRIKNSLSMVEGGSHSPLDRKLVGWMCVGQPRKAAVALAGGLCESGESICRR